MSRDTLREPISVTMTLDRQTGARAGVSIVPFDVVGRLGDEESLRVAVKFEFIARVDGDIRLRSVLVASLDRYQQQTQLDEAEPVTCTQSLHPLQC